MSDTKVLNPHGSVDAGTKIYRRAKAMGAQATYVDAHKEGLRDGRSLARKVLRSQFAGMKPEAILAQLLTEATDLPTEGTVIQ